MPINGPPGRVTQCVPPRLRQRAPEGLSQRSIETDFSGGVITSNGGVTLLREHIVANASAADSVTDFLARLDDPGS